MKLIRNNKSLFTTTTTTALLLAWGCTVPTTTIVVVAQGLTECATGCKSDTDCYAGLVCSSDYQDQLRGLGYDVHKVNCNIRSRYEDGFDRESSLSSSSSDPYVCFNPNVIFSELPPNPPGGAMGDPHFQMFDGTKFSYHGQCDLIMVRSPMFQNGAGLTIHARTDIIDNSWSLISALAIRFGGMSSESDTSVTLEFQNDNTFYYDGVPTTLNNDEPFKFTFRNNEYSITKRETQIDAGTIEDEETNGTSLSSSTSLSNEQLQQEPDIQTHYLIKVGPYRKDIVIGNYRRMMSIRVDTILFDAQGILGSQQQQQQQQQQKDSNTKRGMISRNGSRAFTDPNEMGQEWQVADRDPQLFVNNDHTPQYPEKCILPSNPLQIEQQERRNLRGYSQHEIDRANKACAKVDEGMKQFCIDDVLQTGDVTMAHGYGTGF